MKLLERFEQSIERLMEGTAGSLFNQSIQPAEIGKKLERAMVAQQRVSMGTSIVPNVYSVGLHPKDFGQVADFHAGLARQMEAWLAQVATQRNFSVVDRIRVSIEVNSQAGRRHPHIVAAITDRNPQSTPGAPGKSSPPAQATSIYRFEPGDARSSASLRALDGPLAGRTFIVPPGATSVGRAPDNDIVLNSPDVSRRHARVECTRGGIRIFDLNSTNGTRVNGDAVRVADLDDRDEISFGGQRMTIQIYPSDRPHGRSR